MHLRNSSCFHPKENIQHFYGQQVSSHPNQNKVYLPSVTLTNKNTIQPSSFKSSNNIFSKHYASFRKQDFAVVNNMWDSYLRCLILFCLLLSTTISVLPVLCVYRYVTLVMLLKLRKYYCFSFCNSNLLLFEVRHNFKMGIQLCF